MKKLAQKIYRKTVLESHPVIDAYTRQKFYPVLHKIFGRTVKVTYRPVQKCDHSIYLGI